MVADVSRIFLEASHELLMLGYAVRFRAGGRSMHPTIKDGEMITVEPARAGEIKRGDIVLYRLKRGVIAHRVIGIEKAEGAHRRFILRGDSCSTSDAPVEEEKVLGRVISVEREGRNVDLASRKAKLIRAARSRASRFKPRHSAASLRLKDRSIDGGFMKQLTHSLVSIITSARMFAFVTILFLFLAIAVAPVRAQSLLFQQDFSSSNTVGSYVSATPNNGQFNQITSQGASNVAITGGALTFTRGNQNASFSRSTDFTPTPQVLVYQVDITVSGNTAVQLTAALFRVGSGFGTGNNDETNANTFAKFGINLTATNGTFQIRDITNGTNSANFSGTQTISWILNNSGSTLTYNAPDSTSATLANDRADLYVGNTLVFNDVTVETPTQTMTDLKFVFTTGTASIALDNFLITEIPLSPTAVELISFNALSDETGKVLLQWKTGYEADNLGFNIYREVAGRRVRVNSSPIAGSALLVGQKTALTAGLSYAWVDSHAGKEFAQYWLEDVDLDGKRTLHGPVSPAPGGKLPPQANALLLGKQNSNAPAVQQQLIAPSVKVPGGPGKLGVAALSSLQTQWDVAGQSGAKLSVRLDGWYRVTQPELVAAGFDVSRDPRFLQLYVEGIEVPIKVNGGASGRLEPADSIEFYAKGIDTPSTDLHAYYLINGKALGRRINAVGGGGIQSAALNFPSTIERKERSTYFAALKNGDASNWFGPIITSDVVTQPLSVQHRDSSSATGAVLEIALQGVTAGTGHSVKVTLNGSDVGTITFNGQVYQVSNFNILNAALVEGNNTLTLQALGGETDINLLDYARLTYAHTFAADNNALLLSATGQEAVTVSGFDAAGIRALDVTDPNNPKEITGTTSASGGGFSITVAPQDAGQRVLYAFVDSVAAHPAQIAANAPSSWNRPNQIADLVIISHRNFIASLDSLKALRRSQGYAVSIADVEDIYDEFGYGARTPQAIKDFLARARSNWKRGPRFALLVGDASSDPRNYLGLGDNDFVPTKLIDTAQMETASDDWLVDFNNDGLPEIAIGRLPARTAGESSTMVTKTVSYAQLARPEGVLLVTDRNEGFDFETASDDVKSLIPASIPVREVLRSAMDDTTAHSQIMESFGRGPKIVNYIGHGSFGLWRGNLLTSADAPDLANGPEYSFVITMTCLNGQFQDPFGDGLAESLMKAEQGGAIAVWGSSALTDPYGQALMNKEVMRQIFGAGAGNDQPLTLGEAVMRSKAASSDGDVRRTWVLLGDPLTKLK
ncbi:MAG TPA: signal peptidase I [Blastocatellia bacterium]|nr:signal peptidase I [Blastocatellia bacterium]